jgi:fucose 4-O-acetylase-like acetyltransferase
MNYGATSFSWPVYTADGRDIAIGFYRFGMALLGTGMAFAVVDLLARVKVTRRVLQYLGMVTLGIYCAHTLFVYLYIGSGIFWTIATTLIAIALSIVMIWMLHRFLVTDLLFLGNVKRLSSFNIFRRVRPVTREMALGDELAPSTVKSKPYRLAKERIIG